MANGNPFYVQPAIASESVQRGLSSLGAALGSRIAADRQAEQQAALTEQAQGLIESGDLDAISQFMVANPQYAEGLKGAMQFKNEQTEKNYIDSAYRILRGEDPGEVIRDRAAFVSRQGGSPAETLSALELSPEEIKENARLELSVLDPQGFKSFQEAAGYISPEKREEFDIKRESLNIRKEENETRKLEQKLERETNELRREKLRAEIDAKKQKTEQTKRDVVQGIESGIEGIDRSINTVDRALNHPGLESAVGAGSAFPTLPGSDAADFEAILDTLQSQQFLTAVEQMRGLGALSENEGKKLSSAAGSLSLSMSDKQMKEELARIQDTLQSAKRKLEGRRPRTEQQATQQESQPTVINWSDL